MWRFRMWKLYSSVASPFEELLRKASSINSEMIKWGTLEQFAAFLGQEMAKFAKIVKASGMTATN